MYRAEKFLCPIVLFFLQRILIAVFANLYSHSDIGIRHIGCRRGSWLCLAPAVQPLALDNRGEILIADIQIHIAVDAVNLALFRGVSNRAY